MNPSSRLEKKSRRCAASLALLIALLASATPALADHYDSLKAGHPLRITAYVLHPIGVMIDVLVLRPAHWVASHDGFKTLFGHTQE